MNNTVEQPPFQNQPQKQNDILPKGIVNLGNTCYLNACIQILSQIEPLWTIMQNHSTSRNPTCIENPLWKQWRDIMFIMQSSTSNDRRESLYPNGFLSTIQSISKQKKQSFFQEHAQEDVGEFIQFFFASLHSCMRRPFHISIQGRAQNNTDNLALEVYKHLKDLYMRDEHSEIQDLCTGVLVNMIDPLYKNGNDIGGEHTPEHYRITPDVFNVLNLPIPGKSATDPSKSLNLYDCLNKFSQNEILEKENSWFNEKTNRKEDVRKYIRFWSFPKVLWISLNRSSYDGRKITDLVQYPLELDLSSYCIGYKRTEQVFDLVGICNHMGTVQYGHYTCFVRKDGQWYHCNDIQIQKVEDTRHLETPYASCLVYVKKNTVV